MSSFTARRSLAEEFESLGISGGAIVMETSKYKDLSRITENKIEDDDHELPPGTQRLDCQVAGHTYNKQKNRIGMLRGTNGRVLKSGEKPLLQAREVSFYEATKNSQEPIYKEMSTFTAKYFGTLETTYKNQQTKFLILEDITEGMAEPCVMDVKIGKRTWDPLASREKREGDDRKYAASKKAYGFAIPGFQVYDIETNELRKFGKDYGKKLDAQGVVDALRIFQNASPGKKPCRELVVGLVTYFRKIAEFFRHQKQLRFYSSSILIAYDAQRLRSYIRTNPKEPRAWGINKLCNKFSSSDSGLSESRPKLPKTPKAALAPLSTRLPLSLMKTNRKRAFDRLNKLRRSSSLTGCEFPASPQNSSPTRTVVPSLERSGSYERDLDESLNPLCRTHSYTHNYDRDIVEMKQDYEVILDELVGKSKEQQNWIRVKMIDFTHVFDAEDESLDTNYLDGIENLIKILESFI